MILGVTFSVQITWAILRQMWTGSEIVFHLSQGRSFSPTPSWPFLGASRSSTWSLCWANITEMDAFRYGGKSALFSKVAERLELGWEGFPRNGDFYKWMRAGDLLLQSVRPQITLGDNSGIVIKFLTARVA